MKKKNSKKFVLALLVLLLLTVSVGYSALSTTLNINGTSKINNATWDVHFENIKVTSGSVSATKVATIDTATTTVNYNVDLTKPGDFYEFIVDVKNAGSINAKLSALPTLSGVSAAQDVYTNYTVTYKDGTAIKADDKLASGETKTLKVKVEFDKNVANNQLPTEAQTLNLTFAMNYVQD